MLRVDDSFDEVLSADDRGTTHGVHPTAESSEQTAAAVEARDIAAQGLRKIVDANGNPVAKPWPLDPSGAKLPNPTDQAAAMDFKPYAPAD